MIFVDTGAFVARHLLRDQHHSAAVAGWEQLARRAWPCLTTSFVVDETVTLLARPTADDELVAVEMLEKFDDKDLSFTDCISFVTMRARGVRRAFAFDRHFREAGFVLWPSARR